MRVPKPARIAMRPITKVSPNRFMVRKQCPEIPRTGRGANPVMALEPSILKRAEAEESPSSSSGEKPIRIRGIQSASLAMGRQRNSLSGISAGISQRRSRATTAIPSTRP